MTITKGKYMVSAELTPPQREIVENIRATAQPGAIISVSDAIRIALEAWSKAQQAPEESSNGSKK